MLAFFFEHYRYLKALSMFTSIEERIIGRKKRIIYLGLKLFYDHS